MPKANDKTTNGTNGNGNGATDKANAERALTIANLEAVAAQIGKSEQRTRALCNTGVETADGGTFVLACDVVTPFPHIPSVKFRMITDASVAEYLALQAAGKIGVRAGADTEAFSVWVPKNAEARAAILAFLDENNVRYKARNVKTDADDTDADTDADADAA
jgi:hypothetical protein